MKFKVELEATDFLDYDCGHACTPDGCPGHITDIPISFNIIGTDIELKTPWFDEWPKKEELQQLNKLVVDIILASEDENEYRR